jgi:hypothetical protein
MAPALLTLPTSAVWALAYGSPSLVRTALSPSARPGGCQTCTVSLPPDGPFGLVADQDPRPSAGPAGGDPVWAPRQDRSAHRTRWRPGRNRPGAVPASAGCSMRIAKEQPVVFSAGSSQAGRIPASVRELAIMLEIAPADRSFSFRQVMNLVLQRGIVLTDNRRLPLQRRFLLSELSGPVDLRDGAAVGGEIFRLKNGDSAEKGRFRQIQSTFKSLTGRDLDVRARPVGDGEAALIIEPTVTGQHAEPLVELSGAGVQEALVLSALLRGTPGRITVFDEPAVNLEPTVQRRLVSQVRGPGQYLVITHSADLVPFDQPDDLKRIVRLAPSASGTHIRQPDYADPGSREQFRQLQLIQPAEILALLFAQAAVLCEGQTEPGALPRWWNNARTSGLPDLGLPTSPSSPSTATTATAPTSNSSTPTAYRGRSSPTARPCERGASSVWTCKSWATGLMPPSPAMTRTSPSGAASGNV